ncbi:hypothetical protein [Sphingomonas bacterium]|uniref:hypothetical protein n=1 Tax=Sphingomonas bacterium TaxID=1895847 RepID=UPI001576A80F|nr:hypothetical protein [Sphingomonas bacterium]
MLNMRLKDFYDIWAIAGSLAFYGAVLSRALQAPSIAVKPRCPAETSPALTPGFAHEKQAQWTAFLRRTEIAPAPEPFTAVQAQIAKLVMPPLLRLVDGGSFKGKMANRWPMARYRHVAISCRLPIWSADHFVQPH